MSDSMFDYQRATAIRYLESLTEEWGEITPGSLAKAIFDYADDRLKTDSQMCLNYLCEHGDDLNDIDDYIISVYGSTSNYDGSICPFWEPCRYYCTRAEIVMGLVIGDATVDMEWCYDEYKPLTYGMVMALIQALNDNMGINPLDAVLR